MRLVSLVAVVLLLGCAAPAHAQGELKVGLAAGTFRGGTLDYSPRASLAASFAYARPIGRTGLFVQLEPTYSIKGAATTTTFADVPTPVDVRQRWAVLDLQALLMARWERRGSLHPRLFAGGYVGFPIQTVLTYRPTSGGTVVTVDDDTAASRDYGLVAGLGSAVDVRGERMVFDLRLVAGLANARKREPATHHFGVMLLAGYTF